LPLSTCTHFVGSTSLLSAPLNSSDHVSVQPASAEPPAPLLLPLADELLAVAAPPLPDETPDPLVAEELADPPAPAALDEPLVAAELLAAAELGEEPLLEAEWQAAIARHATTRAEREVRIGSRYRLAAGVVKRLGVRRRWVAECLRRQASADAARPWQTKPAVRRRRPPSGDDARRPPTPPAIRNASPAVRRRRSPPADDAGDPKGDVRRPPTPPASGTRRPPSADAVPRRPTTPAV